MQIPDHLSGGVADVEEAYICTSESRAVRGDGVWMFRVVRRVTSGLDRLLEAYAAPDGPAEPPPGTVCATNATDPLVVYAHRAGGTQAVRAPVGACGFPTQQARAAYESLVTMVVGEQATKRIQSQLSVDSQCPDEFKDILFLDERSHSDGTGGGLAPTPLPDPVPVCTYRVATDAAGDRAGHLDGYSTLSGDRLRAANAALRHARRDPTCSRSEHTRFAVVDMGRSEETVVALDGCAVSQGSSWWRADDQLRQAIAG